jgi:glyoxylase-like metal-dependent hydrolase (beta-lactamase superfamily II)
LGGRRRDPAKSLLVASSDRPQDRDEVNLFNPIRIEANNPSPMTGRGNNTYLLVGAGAAATLIDAGVGDRRHLMEIEHQLALGRARLSQVLVTHAHADHASGTPELAARHRGVRFSKFPWPESDRQYPVHWEPLRDGDELQVGDEPIVVLHTAGHSPDHVAFWHPPSRTAFTGDLVVLGGSVMIEASRGGNMRGYLAALERILSLRPDRLLPAHGSEITSPAEVLRQHLDHRRAREGQVIRALAAGRDTVQAIAESIYDGLHPALVPAARENVAAHLEKLREEGAAFEQNGRWTR